MRVFNFITKIAVLWIFCLSTVGCARMMGRIQRIKPKKMETEYHRWSHVNFLAAFEAAGPMKKFKKEFVTVHAPQKLDKLAIDFIAKVHDCYDAVEKACGIRWRFDSEIYLLPVFEIPENVSFRSAEENTIVAALFVLPGDKSVADLAANNPFFPEAWAHEMTEGTMVMPRENGPAFLMDACAGIFAWNFNTRWFREGLSNYAALVVTKELTGKDNLRKGGMARPFSSLALARHALLRWSQCHGAGSFRGMDSPRLYSAALGLILEIEHYAGKGKIAQMVKSFPEGGAVNGADIEQNLSESLGFKLRDFVRNYRFPFIGVALARRWPDKEALEIRIIEQESPAQKAGLKAGDTLLEINGTSIANLWQLEKVLRLTGAGENALIKVRRKGALKTINLTLGEFKLGLIKKSARKNAVNSGVSAAIRPVY